MQTVLPSGTLTFVFTDIEGSTRQWESRPAEMREALATHDAVVRAAFERHGGHVFKTVGDAFCCAFADPFEAIEAAADVQRSMNAHDWRPADAIRIRAAIHTGTAQGRDGDYFGPALNRTARLLELTRAGNVLVSETTEKLVRDQLQPGFTLADQGEQMLRDVATAQRVYALSAPGFTANAALPPLAASTPTNLPAELTTFVGRKSELQRLSASILTKRIVTVLGPGGVGKTRFALHFARTMLEKFHGGVWLVDLTALGRIEDLAHEVARAMGARTAAPDPLIDIVRACARQPVLLIVDNSERSVGECAAFVRQALEKTAALTILATSREPLHVPGEQTFVLDPLRLPAAGDTLKVLRSSEAVRLFVERAKEHHAAFELTKENADDVADICRGLDGIPLALELAAARMRALSPHQIRERLSARFKLLAGGTGPDHHRTLRGTIDWSFDLLAKRESSLFARAAVFEGPFTLEAAEEVLASDDCDDVASALSELIEKSFLRSLEETGERRYGFFDTLHAYAWEKLIESGGAQTAGAAHFAYHKALTENASGRSDLQWLGAIESSHRDVLGMLRWGIARKEPCISDLALRLANFWQVRGYLGEGAEFLEQTARAVAADEVRCAATYVRAAALRANLGDYEAGLADAHAALRLYESAEDTSGIAYARVAAAGILGNAGEYSQAEDLLRRALEVYDREASSQIKAQTVANLGIVLTSQERFDEAEAELQRALAMAQEIGVPRLEAWVHGALGNVAENVRDYGRARDRYERCLEKCRHESDATGIATALNRLAHVALADGDAAAAASFVTESLSVAAERRLLLQLAGALDAAAHIACRTDCAAAAKLFGAVDRLREQVHFPLPPAEQRARDAAIDRIKASHPDVHVESQRRHGSELSLEEALRIARAALRPNVRAKR